MRRETKAKIAVRVLVALAVTLTSIPAFGAIPQTISYRMSKANSFIAQTQNGQELDLSYIQHLSQIARQELRMTAADFIPTTLSANDSEKRLAEQIIGHSIESWFHHNPFTKETLGEVVQAIEAPLDQSVTLKSASGITHKIAAGFKATRAIASVTYSGIVDASLAYQLTSNTLGLEIARRLSGTQKIVLAHTHVAAEVRETIAWAIEF